MRRGLVSSDSERRISESTELLFLYTLITTCGPILPRYKSHGGRGNTPRAAQHSTVFGKMQHDHIEFTSTTAENLTIIL